MSFITDLPKVELHLHLVGSASPATVLELSRRHPDAGLPQTLAELEAFYAFRDFPHFIEVYGLVSALVRTGDDIVALLDGLARDAAASNVRYAEVTVTPSSHHLAGIAPEETIDALNRGRKIALDQHRVHLNWIFDIAGGLGQDLAWETVNYALRYRPEGLVALGLAGLEVGVGRAQFARQFGVAREAGLHSIVHAGEVTGPSTVWSALNDLGAERIGHGIGSVSDPRLLDHLREHQIPLEVCPTSNVCTRATQSWAQHPLPRLLDHGVPVTLATDDPGMFATTLNREYELAAETFGFSNAELAAIARTGIEAALCEPELKQRLREELAAVNP
ncbi:adenosine deaminase [Tenggerimyces flavus]|uniref:Adenosine deaminase n=1 Tax=Tenggerimyces flavus TaxID=1708749 RepID=A0ABV7Y6N4_9ACTN|nr:adenosine deaminase [Tenggerimyces flavus]MBM7788640.1 aminodeoxyfutalosine deaminase [Tenggerimyces flavus]